MSRSIGINRRASYVPSGPTLKVSNEQALQMLRTKMAQRLSSQASGGELRRSFELLDRDKSGNVELAELEEVFKRFNINLPENQLRSLMSEFDTDGSGRIDFHEFIECVLQPTSNEQDNALRSISTGGVIETLNPGAQADETRFGRIKRASGRPAWLDADGYIKAVKATEAKTEEDAVEGLRQKLWTRFSRYPTIQELKDTFRLLDSDRSGKLSKDEVLEAFHQAGFNLTLKQLDHIMKRFDPDGSGLLDMNEFVYELLSPEQRREEQDAVAQSLRSADVPVPRNAASASVRSASSSSPLPSSLLPVTARRQVSPVKSQVASFMDPPAKKPVEMNKNICTAFKSVSSSHFQSPSSQVLCGSDLKNFNGAALYTTTYQKATQSVHDEKFEVHSRVSTLKNTVKQQQPNRHTMNILRHLGAKLLQRRGGVREFWTAFKFMDLDGSGEVSADELIRAIKLLNVDMLPEEADDVLNHIKDADGRVTYTSFRKTLEESVHTLHD